MISRIISFTALILAAVIKAMLDYSPQKGTMAILASDEMPSHKDADKISQGALASVSNMYRYGIMSGMANGKFSPDSIVTWAQAAKMVCNMLTGNLFY